MLTSVISITASKAELVSILEEQTIKNIYK